MSDIKVNFDELPESKDFKSINTAGVHLKYHLEEIEFTDAKEKDGKMSNPFVKITVKSDVAQFGIFKFSPPSNPEDVKFTSDVYQNGKAVRKMTPEEQIQKDFTELFYFYEQLGRALGGTKDQIEKFKSNIKGVEMPVMFKTMFDKFFTIFPLDKVKAKLFNFKALWNNNDKSKTSFLGISKAGASNMVFAPYVSDSNPVLSVGGFEEKNMIRKYSPIQRVPAGDATEVKNEDGSTGGFQANANIDEKDLF